MYRFAQIVPIECMKFRIISAKELVQSCADDKSLNPLKQWKSCGNLLIDDLGEEKEFVANYSNTDNPMDVLLSARYEAYISHGHLTHFTSNKQPSELEDRYGTRIFDRICETAESNFCARHFVSL